MTPTHYDVFISRKSQDAHLAKELYDFLTSKGLKVFDSLHSLPELGNADYQKAIDHALDACTHMIVVGSSVEHITASWVEAEWRLFINEKRSGYKKGNILSVVTNNVTIRSLPASLRYYEVVVLEKANFERVLAYVKTQQQQETTSTTTNSTITPQKKEKGFWETLFSNDDTNQNPSKVEVEKWFNKGWEESQKENYAEAVKWYRKAAEQGNANAQNNLGWMYDNGQGVTQDYVEAVKWYRKAAEQGNANAQNNLGWMCENGTGVTKNITEAIRWYQLSAKQGNETAQENLKRLNQTW